VLPNLRKTWRVLCMFYLTSLDLYLNFLRRVFGRRQHHTYSVQLLALSVVLRGAEAI